MDVKFKSWLHVTKKDPQRQVVTCSGSAFVDVLRPVVKDDGSVELIKDGETSLYDQIQSYKDSCDINRILQRYVNGDQSALNARAMQFFDSTEFPTTYAEMLNVVINGERIFNELPVETKEKFGNDYHKFIATFGSDSWLDALGASKKAPAASDQSVSEVVEGEAE